MFLIVLHWINSDAGKAKVTLSVELGDAHHLPAHSHQRTRNGPARQRRRLRRELARNNAKAEEATSAVVAYCTYSFQMKMILCEFPNQLTKTM